MGNNVHLVATSDKLQAKQSIKEEKDIYRYHLIFPIMTNSGPKTETGRMRKMLAGDGRKKTELEKVLFPKSKKSKKSIKL